MITQVLELYARVGKSLIDDVGVSEAALPIHMTSDALGLFANCGWQVLGGDVYQYNNGRMSNFYADWFCDTTDCIESCHYAMTHLNKLKGDNLFISFVIKKTD